MKSEFPQGEPMAEVEIDTIVSFHRITEKPTRVVADSYLPADELARGKKILNIGCCGSDAVTNYPRADDHPHGRLTRVSSRCLGIDIFERGVGRLRELGLEAIHANAESFDLPEKDFDLAVLGDVIEHVSNPGLVLDNTFRHLKGGGRVFVSTPNAFSISYFTSNLLKASYRVNSEHVLWFDPGLLAALLQRSGFVTEEILWMGYDQRLFKRLIQRIRPSMMAAFGIIARKPE